MAYYNAYFVLLGIYNNTNICHLLLKKMINPMLDTFVSLVPAGDCMLEGEWACGES